MSKTIHRLAVGALAVGLGLLGIAPAMADHVAGDSGDTGDEFVDEEPFRGSLGNLLRSDLVSNLPVVNGVAGSDGGLLGGLLGGSGGLLGERGLLGSEGGVLPGLLGGHTGVPEFTEGTGELVDGLIDTGAVLVEDAPPVGGRHIGEDMNLAGGLLDGVLDVDGLVGGLLGRF